MHERTDILVFGDKFASEFGNDSLLIFRSDSSAGLFNSLEGKQYQLSRAIGLVAVM